MTLAVELLAFAGVMALGQFSPGPDMILLTRTALKGGAPAGVWMAFGIAIGLVIHSTVAFAGLAVAFRIQPLLGGVLSWAAAAWLLWMSWRIAGGMLRRPISALPENADPAPPAGRPFLRGLVCNLLNPKAAVFLAAVSAPFLQVERPAWWPVALGAIVVIQGGLLWALWACLLQWRPVGRIYRKLEPAIDGVFAAVLLLLAALLISNPTGSPAMPQGFDERNQPSRPQR